jgi:hypothetical protein
LSVELKVESSTRWQMELALGFLLVLVTLLAYGPLLVDGAFPYSPHSDILVQHLTMKQLAYESLQQSQGLPLWKTDLIGGGPALTHPQALYTNPLQLLFLVLEPTAAVGPTLWLHFLAMALSFQVLGAVLGLGYWARGFMALAGLFSFKLILITHAGWLPVLPGFVCAPLLLAAVLHLMDRPSLRAVLLLALAGSLGLHGGHLQIFYYASLFLALYVAVEVAGRLRRGEHQRALYVVSGCLLAAVLAAATSAYLMLPLAAETALTERSASSWEYFLGRGGSAASNLVTFLHPEALGTPLDGSYADVELWEDVAYFGAAPELLALLGVLLGWRRRHVRFLSVSFAASLLLLFDSPVLRILFEGLPGFSLFRNPGRFLFLTTLLGIALSGVGVEELRTRFSRWPRWRSSGSFPRPRLADVCSALLVLAVIAEGMFWVGRYLPMVRADLLAPETQYAAFLNDDPSAFRVAPIGRFTINYGWASLLGLELVTGFDAYNYRHYRRYFDLMHANRAIEKRQAVWMDLEQVGRWDLLDALNVKYVVTTGPLSTPRPSLERVARFEDEPIFAFYQGFATAPIFVYENHNALPRAYWATQLTPASDGDDALQRALRYDLRKHTVVEGAGVPLPSFASFEPFEPLEDREIRIAHRQAGHLVLETSNEQRGFAVISEIWHPGWSAVLDGEPLALYRANVAMLGAWVPAGEHRLELRFEPLYWSTARAVSIAGCLTLAGLGAFALRGSRS